MWNYRIVSFKESPKSRKRYYKLCEVFYTEEGKPYGCATADICGDSINECQSNYLEIAEAFHYAPLKCEDFVEPDFKTECVDKDVKRKKVKK